MSRSTEKERKADGKRSEVPELRSAGKKAKSSVNKNDEASPDGGRKASPCRAYDPSTLHDHLIKRIFQLGRGKRWPPPSKIIGPPHKTVLNSSSPVFKYCYDCNRVVWTKIKYYPTSKTKLIAFGLSPCLLCWVPFFCHWKSELDHHCSDCGGYLGTYDPFVEHKMFEAFTSVLPADRPEERRQRQKKYREVGRRCGAYQGPSRRDEIIRVYSDILQ